MKMKYIVHVSYHSFSFDDMIEANAFALMAKEAYVENKRGEHGDVDVQIELMEIEDEPEGEPEDTEAKE